jgi:hypothetical protein
VDLPNLDLIFHNAFSNFSGQPFDIGCMRQHLKERDLQARRDCPFFRNIHATMSAIIAVLNTRGTVTQATGKYSIAGVPAGNISYEFSRASLPENLRFLERRITVPESGLVLPPDSISRRVHTGPHSTSMARTIRR